MDISSITHLVSSSPAPTETSFTQPVPEDQRTLIRAVHAVDAAQLFGADHELTFTFERGSHRAVVRVVNRETGDLVEQIPAEYVLRLAEELNVAKHPPNE